MTQDEQRGWTTGAVLLLGVFVVSKAAGGLDNLLEKLGLKKSDEEKAVDDSAENPYNYWSPIMWQRGPAGTKILTSAASNDLIVRIVNAYGFSVDHAAVISALKSVKTQSQLSYLVYMFAKVKGLDLLAWLRDKDILWTWPYQRLSDEEIESLNDYFDKLPKYY